MTGSSAHDTWAELAVGYALNALEPDDEALYVNHDRGCGTCAQLVIDTRAVMGEMAYAAEPVSPPPAVWTAIQSALNTSDRPPLPASARSVAEEGGPSRPVDRDATVVALADRRRPMPGWARWVASGAVAAVLVTVALLGAVVLNLRGENATQHRQLDAVASCLEVADCQPVAMGGSGDARAVALVRDGQVRLLVDRLPRNNRAREVYVLWALRGTSEAVPVTTFDVSTSGRQLIAAHPLPADLSSTTAFAVTRETGRQAPPAPTGPKIVSGAVST